MTEHRSAEPKFEQVLVEYIQSVEAGNPLDRNRIVAAHPELRSELESFFQCHDMVLSIRQEQPATVDSATPHLVGATTLADQPPSPSSSTHFGDYELLDEIARGGMGVVYRARQRSLDRIVALKMIKSGELASQDQIERFYKEAEAAAQLDHPGIVPVYGVGEFENQHYFTMGFVEGESLAERLGHGVLTPNHAARYTRALAEAVVYAHSKGVIHRDIKPGNILITVDDLPRITDFGLAKRIEEESELTSTGQILGTPSYMPPEQAEGKLHDIGPAADVYAIGATLYCMLVGRPPFQSANVVETLRQVIEQIPVSLRSLNDNIAVDLETLCLKCLEKNPRNRYHSVSELRAELDRFLKGEPIEARPISRWEKAWRWCKKKPLAAGFLALLMVLAFGGPWLGIHQLRLSRANAISRVDTLLNASPATIPVILRELDRDTPIVRSQLVQLSRQKLSDAQQLRVSLALLPTDSTQLDYLKTRILDCSYEELAVALERLRTNGGEHFLPVMWEILNDRSNDENKRFRSAIALASLDPSSNQWSDTACEFLVRKMLSENSLHQIAIRNSLRPISDKLVVPVQRAFAHSQDSAITQEASANALVVFALARPDVLVELSMVATSKQYKILFPYIVASTSKNPALVQEFSKVCTTQPESHDLESTRVALGRRRASAATSLLRLGYPTECLPALQIREDPELPNAPRNWLMSVDVEGFRLPTAAEWEIACRAETGTAFGFGSDRDMLRHQTWKYPDHCG